MLPRLPTSHCVLICAWRWLTYMIKDTWLSACLEAFQGLSQWKQLGFIFNLITLWKSLVYKHICLTSNHFDLMLRSPGSACCHSFACGAAARWSRTPFLLQVSLGSTTFLTFSIATTLLSPLELPLNPFWTPATATLIGVSLLLSMRCPIPCAASNFFQV